jgi:hypothetical protein
MLERHIADRRVIALIRSFVFPFGPGKSLGLGSQVSQIAAIFYPNMNAPENKTANAGEYRPLENCK